MPYVSDATFLGGIELLTLCKLEPGTATILLFSPEVKVVFLIFVTATTPRAAQTVDGRVEPLSPTRISQSAEDRDCVLQYSTDLST